MSSDRRPTDVFPDGSLELPGYNCVAAVAAVLHNERFKARFMSAQQVVSAYNISPLVSLGLVSALAIIEKVLRITPATGRNQPWEPMSRPGDYAVFCLGRPHVLYGQRGAHGHYYLYDPQTQRDWQLAELSGAGLAPAVGYFFPNPAPAP